LLIWHYPFSHRGEKGRFGVLRAHAKPGAVT
jgi:hypothetical protein